jgi:hypothetical protein
MRCAFRELFDLIGQHEPGPKWPADDRLRAQSSPAASILDCFVAMTTRHYRALERPPLPISRGQETTSPVGSKRH